MSTNLEGLMNRISALIAKADSTPFPEEAKTYRAKAEELLRKYRIEESELISTGGTEITPVVRRIDVSRSGAEFLNAHFWIWNAVARHCGIRSHEDWVRTGSKYGYVATAVGYDVDLRWAEMLFASALLVFGQHLEPEVDPNETDAENVYRLRSAGIPRNKIANMLWGASLGSQGAPAHGKAGRLYKEECERRGEQPIVSGRTVNAKTYREAYAQKFVTAFERRLREARDAANSSAGALVLVGRSEKVDEAFYKLFPHLRPKTAPETTEVTVSGGSGKTKALSKTEQARIHRLYYGPAAQAAGSAARVAAAKVRLDRSTTAADRLAERHDRSEQPELNA
jgi:hypothetical protein